METTRKPKLVFFQWDHSGNPGFVQAHMHLHAKCLAEFFDLTVIHGNCNFQQVCDKFEPDLALFEAGVNYRASRRPTIEDISANPGVPRIGLHNGDGWCDARAGFIADMARWRVETFFTISTTTGEHTPELKDHLFVWPNFIDDLVFRDYGEAKRIPVLMPGKIVPHYPWRNRIRPLLMRHFPTLLCPHPGYGVNRSCLVLEGESYARTINASWFVPACGTAAREVVRKHFEIPAARACLVSEWAPSLEAAGFRDMENCVIADVDDIVEKLRYLLDHPDELGRIIDAGYRLVHSEHTLRRRGQMLQWFELQQSLASNEKIIQRNPFGPLSRAPAGGASDRHIRCDGPHLQAMREGDAALAVARYDDAHARYTTCRNLMQWMPEPKLRLGICELYRGNASAGQQWISEPLAYTLDTYRAHEPDPVEWAYAIVAHMCAGDIAGAAERAERFPTLVHPELDRVRWALAVVRGQPEARALAEKTGKAKNRSSVHSLPQRPLDEWVEHLSAMLEACGRGDIVPILWDALDGMYLAPTTVRAGARTKSHQPRHNRRATLLGAFFPLLEPLRPAAAHVVHRLNRLEKRYGYFLPYRYSEIRNDEFVGAVKRLVLEKEVRTALVIGAAAGAASTEAVLSAARDASCPPQLVFASRPTWSFRILVKRCIGSRNISIVTLNDPSHRAMHATLGAIACPSGASHRFDLALVDALHVPGGVNPDLIHGVKLIVLNRINQGGNATTYQHFLTHPGYDLIAQSALPRGGYAIFERLDDEPTELGFSRGESARGFLVTQ